MCLTTDTHPAPDFFPRILLSHFQIWSIFLYFSCLEFNYRTKQNNVYFEFGKSNLLTMVTWVLKGLPNHWAISPALKIAWVDRIIVDNRIMEQHNFYLIYRFWQATLIKDTIKVVLFCFLRDRFSLCSPGFIDQAGLELIETHLPLPHTKLV